MVVFSMLDGRLGSMIFFDGRSNINACELTHIFGNGFQWNLQILRHCGNNVTLRRGIPKNTFDDRVHMANLICAMERKVDTFDVRMHPQTAEHVIVDFEKAIDCANVARVEEHLVTLAQLSTLQSCMGSFIDCLALQMSSHQRMQEARQAWLLSAIPMHHR